MGIQFNAHWGFGAPPDWKYGNQYSVQEQLAASFFRRAVTEDLSPADMFRITTTSFMDAYNFDIRQLMKSCVHHLLPTGHLIPFCAYNVLYRDGHVPLPSLAKRIETYSIDSFESGETA